VPFDIQKFNRSKFVERTKQITIQEFSMFFGEGETPTVTIRGLTAEEVSTVRAEVETASENSRLLEQLAATAGNAKADAVAAILEASRQKTPDDHVRNLHTVLLGLIEPTLDLQQVVKLSIAMPIPFINLANQIWALTGEGRIEKKLSSSGVTLASEQP